MPHSAAWDETAPNGATTAASDIDLVIRNLKRDIRERLVNAGLVDFATDDPVGFDLIRMLGATPYVIGGSSSLEFRNVDGTTVNMRINAAGNVEFRTNINVAASVFAVLLTLTGLASFNGGLTVAAAQTAEFNGPVSMKDTVTVDTGQANIVPQAGITSGVGDTIDFNQGNNVHLTLAHNPVTLTLANPRAGAHYFIKLIQDATGSRTVVWPANVIWPANAAAPTLTTTALAFDTFALYYDGTNYIAQACAFGYVE